MLRPGDVLNNKYRIVEFIGKGGMSKVWRAKDTNRGLNHDWAVKEISKTSDVYRKTVNEKKALHEIEIMKSLDHPALPRIVDVIDGPTTLCVVMDYVPGISLQRVLDEYGVQKEQAVVSWMLEVCDILTYLHSKNPPIIYRDIKPSNLMVNSDGHIKIIDFGIARENIGDDTMALGSEGYASPEHFEGKTDVRSDVYTIGSTAYALLTGKNQKMPPYYIEPIRKINPALSQGLEKVILKATKKNPDERYQSAAELANALESYEKLDDEYITSLRKDVSAFRRRLIASAAAMIIGLFLIAAGIVSEQTDYNNLVTSPGGTYSTRVKNLERAIDLKPKREEAYLSLIEVYAEDGRFTEEESDEFFKAYNPHKSAISSELNYKLGEAYLRYYTGKSDASARAKLLTAEPFFKSAKEDKTYGSLSEGYVFLSEYYKTFVLSDDSLLTQEGSEKDYRDMLDTCKSTIENAPNDKMRKITAEACIGLLQSQLPDLKEAGIPEKDLLSLLSLAEEGADEEIISLALDAKDAVKRVYHSKAEGGHPNA